MSRRRGRGARMDRCMDRNRTAGGLGGKGRCRDRSWIAAGRRGRCNRKLLTGVGHC